VEDVMSRTPMTIPSDFTMEEVADVLLKNEAYGALVVDGNNQLVGVVTQRDINRVFISLTGLRKGGIAFGFLLEDSPGSIKDVTDILRSHGARIQSILTSYERTVKGYRNVQIRVRKLNRASLPRILQELREKGRLLYKIDHRENTREVYGEGEQ
jgi:acetoin utilization protein AcuB